MLWALVLPPSIEISGKASVTNSSWHGASTQGEYSVNKLWSLKTVLFLVLIQRVCTCDACAVGTHVEVRGELVLSFHHVGFRDGTQVVRLSANFFIH